tara:strand:+ start:25578 stop:26975 length:1398 start_codon:yes stop_codon:yes gene_type:complete
MALNPFFLQGSQGEQSLVQDLINEQLRMYGVEVYYIPRQYVTQNTIIREVIESEFNQSYPIEAYVNNFDGYGDNTQLLSKFGIQATNEINLIISQERFKEYITPLIRNLSNVKLATRPKEGDLIYFPLGKRLFEIKFVEHEKPFYQLQKNYVYELRCELFRYEDEDIDTGIEEIDELVQDVGNIKTLTLIGSGEAATASAGIVNGGVVSINITDRGEGYLYAPTVAISTSPTAGGRATGIATLLGGLTNCDGTQIGSKVQGVEITNPGFGYTVAPGVAFVGLSTAPGVGAAATTVIGDGVVGVVTISSGGSGYAIAPLVTISSPGIGTTAATAIAIISAAGTVTDIRFTNAGSGYTVAPTITIGDPATGASGGTFVENETVTGADSGVTGRVKSWNAVTNTLNITEVTGDFTVGEIITGSIGGATYMVTAFQEDNVVGAFPDNDTIQNEANAILDFSEKNPFGTP